MHRYTNLRSNIQTHVCQSTWKHKTNTPLAFSISRPLQIWCKWLKWTFLSLQVSHTLGQLMLVEGKQGSSCCLGSLPSGQTPAAHNITQLQITLCFSKASHYLRIHTHTNIWITSDYTQMLQTRWKNQHFKMTLLYICNTLEVCPVSGA